MFMKIENYQVKIAMSFDVGRTPFMDQKSFQIDENRTSRQQNTILFSNR